MGFTISSSVRTTTGDADPGGVRWLGGAGGATSTGGESVGKAGSADTTTSGGTPAGGAAGSLSSGGTGSTILAGTGGSTATLVVGGKGTAGQTGGTASAGSASGDTTASGGGTVTGSSTASGGVTSNGGRSGFPARFVGNLDVRASIPTDFFQYWDQLTPESAGRWQSVQSQMTTFNWSRLDAMVRYCEEHNVIFKETTFIMGDAHPGWLNKDNALESARAWMKAFCDRYPNTRLIDVVNQPTHSTPSYAAGLGGGTFTTWEWVANSFKLAREACPNAILILNDYNNCEYATDHQKFIDMVKTIQKLDAPVDAIGCAAWDAARIPVSKFKEFMDRLASETGLPIYITEFEIGLADAEQQRAKYADYFTMFWDDPIVKGVTVWGYITGATWRTNTGIMGSDGAMRPAMSWLMGFLQR